MERGCRRNDFTKNDYSSEVSCIDKKGIAWNTWRKVAVGMSMEMERRFHVSPHWKQSSQNDQSTLRRRRLFSMQLLWRLVEILQSRRQVIKAPQKCQNDGFSGSRTRRLNCILKHSQAICVKGPDCTSCHSPTRQRIYRRTHGPCLKPRR